MPWTTLGGGNIPRRRRAATILYHSALIVARRILELACRAPSLVRVRVAHLSFLVLTLVRIT